MTGPTILVTSTMPDRLNTNVAIRSYLHDALEQMVGSERVTSCPLDVVETALDERRPSLLVGVGSLAHDSVDWRRIRRAADAAGSAIALWLHDDPYEFDYGFKADGVADIVFTNDGWSALHYEHPNVHHLPLAGSPQTHHRPIAPLAEREFALSFCGVAYANRVDLVRRIDGLLAGYPVAILGAEWPLDLRCARNQRLSPHEMADLAASSRLSLNVGRVLDIANARYSLPPSTPGPRTFEVALSGSAQLAFVTSLEMLDYFENGTEIILIQDVGDIREALERAYDDPESIEAIARRAQERALRDHTYVNRAADMLSACARTLGRFEHVTS